jgi:hypothetical protein
VPALILTLLKVGFLAVLFLFIVWVLRVALRELRESVEPANARADALAKPAELQVIEPREHRGTRIPLVHGMTIGRDPDCNLQLDDGYVSTQHARIVTRGDDFFVEDAGSTNGTFVNRRRVAEPTLVRRGDTVQIGRTVMEVVR